MIGDDIKIVVTSCGRKNGEPYIHIGIEAPKEIPVHRQEVYNAIKKETSLEAGFTGK